MASIPRVAAFPMTCPECAAAAGFPFRATTIPAGIDVDVRCHACRHQWMAFMERAKPDRNQQSAVVVHQPAS